MEWESKTLCFAETQGQNAQVGMEILHLRSNVDPNRAWTSLVPKSIALAFFELSKLAFCFLGKHGEVGCGKELSLSLSLSLIVFF